MIWDMLRYDMRYVKVWYEICKGMIW